MWEYNHYDELCHYGVLGMKWGVRRAEKMRRKAQTIETKTKTKEELKASIERGKKVYQRIAKNNPFDPEKHSTIYDALNKKDAADYRAYKKDLGKKEVAVILTALTGVTVATLLTPNKG